MVTAWAVSPQFFWCHFLSNATKMLEYHQLGFQNICRGIKKWLGGELGPKFLHCIGTEDKWVNGVIFHEWTPSGTSKHNTTTWGDNNLKEPQKLPSYITYLEETYGAHLGLFPLSTFYAICFPNPIWILQSLLKMTLLQIKIDNRI